MNRHRLIIVSLLLIFSYALSFAQVTNVRKWRKTEKDSLENGLFLYDEKSYLQALPIFDSIFHHHPDEEFIKYVYAKCSLCRSDKHEDAYTYLSEVYQKNKRVEDIQYDMALAAHYTDKFDEALEHITTYLDDKHLPLENKKAAEMLRQFINNGKYYTSRPTLAKINDMGSAVNSPDDEYTPAIKADETSMIFTYVGPKSIGGRQNLYLQPDPNGNYMEDVYLTHKINNEFIAAFPLDSVNTNASEAAVSLSNDGSVLFIFKNENDNHGDIYQSELIGEHYTKPRKLQGQVNTYSWDGNCSLSPDGKTLYFSSERSGGNGGRDIYKASLSADGSWQNVKNLGDTVNTPYDEDAPFIHPDGVTLYYSTNGKKSMGGYDVMKASMNLADSTFKKTENLGSPINTTDDDLYFVTSANSEIAYYSSGRKGGKGLRDIYQIETHFTGPKPSLYLVKGDVQNDGAAVAATITVELPEKNTVYGTFGSNANTGLYLISLTAGEKYKLTFKHKGLPSKTLEVDLVGTAGYSEKTFNVDFGMRETPSTPVSSSYPITPPVVKPVEKELTAEKAEAARVAREQAAAKAKADADAKAEAARIAREDAAVKAKADADARAEAQRIAQEKAKANADAKTEAARIAREDAEAKARADIEARAEAQHIAQEKAKADAAVKAETARIAGEEAAAKTKSDADARAQTQRIAQEKAKANADAKAEAARIAKEDAEAKARADIEARAEAQRIAQEKAKADATAKADAARIAKEQTDAKAKADAQTRAEAAIKAQKEGEARAAAQREAFAKAKADAAAKTEAAHAAKEEADAKAKADRVAKENAAVEEAAKTLAAGQSKTKTPVPAKTTTPIANADTEAVFSATKDGFVPRTPLHEKAIRYIEKYGDLSLPGLEFRVQLAAFKVDRNQAFPNLARYGKIERVLGEDGYTRMYIGGTFKTLKIAFALTKRVVLAGHIDAFVAAIYKGKRMSYEELEEAGVFK